MDQQHDEIQPRPWWQRWLDLPCFVVLAGAQIVRRRCGELTLFFSGLPDDFDGRGG